MATKESALNATILEEYEDEDGEEDIEFGLMTLPFEDEDGEGDFEFGLMARSETPPKDTTLAAAIEMFDLPQCYSTCMQQEDGKFSIHMGKVINDPSSLTCSPPFLSVSPHISLGAFLTGFGYRIP